MRGIDRRSIPWRDVQAVIRFDQLGVRRVLLNLESGEPVNLRPPESTWGFGRAAYERDFPAHRPVVARIPWRVLVACAS